MIAKIEFKVDKCVYCPFHEKHQIMTADSFEHEIGIYCSKVEDISDSWARNTYDGRVDKKLVVADDWHANECSDVPDWCPCIIRMYTRFIKEINKSDEWKQSVYTYSGFEQAANSPSIHKDGEKHIMDIIVHAICFLQDLKQADIKSFLYSDYNHFIVRDVALMEIAAMLHSIGSSPKESAEIANNKYLAGSNLSCEDKEIIIDAILHWADFKANIEKFDETKERAKVYKKYPILDTLTAIKVSLYLANTLSMAKVALPDSATVKFKFVYNEKLDNGDYGKNPKNAAELHYTADSDFNPHVFELYPKLIEVPRTVAKDFLGFRSFKVFVNDKEFKPHLKKSPT